MVLGQEIFVIKIRDIKYPSRENGTGPEAIICYTVGTVFTDRKMVPVQKLFAGKLWVPV